MGIRQVLRRSRERLPGSSRTKRCRIRGEPAPSWRRSFRGSDRGLGIRVAWTSPCLDYWLRVSPETSHKCKLLEIVEVEAGQCARDFRDIALARTAVTLSLPPASRASWIKASQAVWAPIELS